MKAFWCRLGIVLIALFSLQLQAAVRNFQQIIDSGELRVGVSPFAPWVIKAKNGAYTGSEADIARRLADDMNLKLTFVEQDWEQLIPALNNGRIDVIVSGMSVSPSRALKVNFSRSYAQSGIGLATHIEKTKHVKTLDDMQSADITIGAVADSTAATLSKRVFKLAKLKNYYSMKEASAALLAGEIHALVAPSAELGLLVLRHPKVIDRPLASPLLKTYEAFAVRKGDYDFVNFLNAWILARRADGWLDSTRYYWFDTLRWQGLVE